MLSTSYSDGTITLQNGWNLISIPKNLSSGYDTVAVVFAGINTGGHSIFHYNGRTQYWDALQSSTVLKPLEGYYVYSVGAFTLDTYYVGAGQQQNPSVKLYQGWNMIGYFDPMGNSADDYFHAAMARDELAQLGSSWASVQGFDPQTQQYETSITNGGSYSHSDYRLMYPEKGYWIWMNSGVDSWTISASHTYYCSAEWVSDYPGDGDLPDSEDNAEGFYTILNNEYRWSGSFIYGDSDADEDHWKDIKSGGHDYNYIDDTNFAFFSGHGNPGLIVFSDGISSSDLTYNEALWGNTTVDWITLAACNVLDESNNNYALWGGSFKGLHSIIGWETVGSCDPDLGTLFANRLCEDYTIGESWKYATDSVIPWTGYRVGILAVDTDGNTNTKECIEDHIYMHGSWFSPPGYNVQFDHDFHDCEP